jgi:DNA-binding protein HU-beta
MTQSELIAQIAADAGVTQAEAGRLLDATMSAISKALAKGGEVRLSSLGIFDVADRAAREGRNPATGEALKIAASKAVRFRASKGLKDAVNGAKK